jgi:transcriptional regulator with XRE-family HTH domain
VIKTKIQTRAALRNERKKLDLTQSELALKLNIAEITVRKIESGDRNPGMTMTKKYVDFFNKDASYLFPDIFLPLLDTKRIKKSKQEVG